MNLIKKTYTIFLFTLLLFFIISCRQSKYPGYSQSSSGFHYKIHLFGETNQKPVPTDYITVDIEYRVLENDSLFFSGRRKFQTTTPDYKGSVDECFAMMSVDDSASFIINAYKFFTKTLYAPLPDFLNKNSDLKINVKLLNIQSREKFLREKKEFLSWIKDLSEYEQTFLNNFIEEKDISIQPSRNGLYCIKTHETSGVKIEKGMIVNIHYEGQFLNGKYFIYYGAKVNKNILTWDYKIFERVGKGLFKLHEDDWNETSYPIERIKFALSEKFSILEVKPMNDGKDVLFVCRKK